MKKTLKVNYKLLPFITKPQPIKVAIGGRNSGKSLGIGDILTFKMESEGADIYCLREFQDSITDSVHKVFKGSIEDRLCLEGWEVLESRIIAPNGARTTYKGANRNPDAMQSAQGYKYSWFEEAQRSSQASLDKLLPTILRNPGAQCWFTGNPQSSSDPFSQRFIVPYLSDLEKYGFYEDDLHYIVVVNWRDNPWWNKEGEALRAWDHEHLSRAKYDWIWEGKFNDEVEGSIIKPEWFDAAIDAHKLDKLKEVFKPHGARIVAHDPFDDGADAGGLAVRHGSIIEQVRVKDSGEIDKVCDWAVDITKSCGADWFVWDGDGMGTGLKRQVSLAFDDTRTDYYMFKGSLSGSGQDNADLIYQPEYGNRKNNPKTYAETFKNNRAQYYIKLADRLYNTYKCVVEGEYIAPELMLSFDSDGLDDILGLRSELCRIPRKLDNDNGLEQLLSKKEMKAMKISSPNMSDSVMMSLFIPATKKKKKKKLNYQKSGIA